jgi:hypothetical protein
MGQMMVSRERLCVWCWYEQHPHQPFPADRSSSMCGRHAAWERGRRRESRAVRRAVSARERGRWDTYAETW